MRPAYLKVLVIPKTYDAFFVFFNKSETEPKSKNIKFQKPKLELENPPSTDTNRLEIIN